MSIRATTMYDASCDAGGCTRRTRDFEDGNAEVYEDLDQLNDMFSDTREGSLTDGYGWLRIPEWADDGSPADKHYCAEHTVWDEDQDILVPAPGNRQEQARTRTAPAHLGLQPAPLQLSPKVRDHDHYTPRHLLTTHAARRRLVS